MKKVTLESSPDTVLYYYDSVILNENNVNRKYAVVELPGGSYIKNDVFVTKFLIPFNHIKF